MTPDFRRVTQSITKMKVTALTQESLATIYRAIDSNGGEVKIRNLDRIYGIPWLVIKQAKEEGFIEFFERKGKTGRPSELAKKVSNMNPTKLPPLRSNLEDLISQKQWDFAFHYVMGEYGPGFFDFKRRAYVAYQKAYRSAVSKGGAKASASRLLRKPGTRAAIQWEFAKMSGENNGRFLFPRTTNEVWDALREIGSFRAKWAPYWVKWRWKQEEK